MAGLSLYFINSTPGDTLSSDGSLQINGTPPSVATSTSGWTVSTTAASRYSLFLFNTTRAASTFGTTALPSANPVTNDCLRTGNALTGTIAAGTWNFAISLKGLNTNAVASGNLRLKVWHSPTRAGNTNATQIGSGTIAFTTVTNLTSSAAQNTTASASLPAVTLNNEYLFFQFAYEIDTASTATTAGLVFVQDGTNSVITTPTFTATGMSVIGNATTTLHDSSTTTANFTTPTSPGTGNGPQSGDTLIAWVNIYDNQGVTITPPTGWNIYTGTRVDVPGNDDALCSVAYYLVLTGTPSTTYAFTCSPTSTTGFDIVGLCVRNVKSIDSGNGAPTTNNGGFAGGGTPTALGLTTSVNNELVIPYFALDESGNTAGPSGYTVQVQSTTGGGGFAFYALYTLYQTSAGATGNLTTTNAAVSNWNAINLALISTFSTVSNVIFDNMNS
jgi:hypothetical protein